MKRNKYVERSFIMLTLAAAVIFLFSFGGAAAYETVWNGEERLPADTEISGVDVSGLAISEAEAKLREAIEEWKQQSGLTLTLFDEKVPLHSQAISFHIEETIDAARLGGRSSIQAEISPQIVEEHLLGFPYVGLEEKVDVESLSNELVSSIDLSASNDIAVDVGVHHPGLEKTAFNEVTLPLSGTPEYFQEWVNHLDGYMIEKNENFSFLLALEERGALVFDDPALDKLASAVFQVLAETNLALTERHIPSSLQEGISIGDGADVKPGERDLRFFSPNMYTYELDVSIAGGSLHVSLYGFPFLHDYTLETVKEETITPRTIVRFNEDRMRGDRVTLSNGENGHYAEIVRVTRNKDGVTVEEEMLGQEYYPPEHRLEEWSLQDESDLTDEIPEGEWNPEEDRAFEDEDKIPHEDGNEQRESSSNNGTNEDGESDNDQSEQETDEGNGNENMNGLGTNIGPDGKEQPLKGLDVEE